ncbi:MAG: acyl-CoA thioesterase [Acidimicrobiales bacterium]
MIGLPRPNDLDFLHLEVDPDMRHSRFELVADLARQDGALYGGTAIAASVVAMEAATGRGALWATTQYVAVATMGAVIECTTEVLAMGRNLAQVQVTGRVDDKVMFVSLGSTAEPRADGLEGQYLTMPDVEPLSDAISPITMGPPGPDGFAGFGARVEIRPAALRTTGESDPSMTLWVRRTDDREATPAGIAFLADMVPPAIALSAGWFGGGSSLDNSLRFGRIPNGVTWMLLEMRGAMATGGHGHGSVNVWTPDGSLLAVGGQSANMIYVFGPKDAEVRAAFQTVRTP